MDRQEMANRLRATAERLRVWAECAPPLGKDGAEAFEAVLLREANAVAKMAQEFEADARRSAP
jgi:hypothetical protein